MSIFWVSTGVGVALGWVTNQTVGRENIKNTVKMAVIGFAATFLLGSAGSLFGPFGSWVGSCVGGALATRDVVIIAVKDRERVLAHFVNQETAPIQNI